jgi:putative NADH-flavin reductase
MSSLHFFLAGATGRSGRAFATAACAAGHRVTAFVRRPDARSVLPAEATIVQGDVLDADAVARSVAGEHIIVSTLGGGAPNAPGSALSAGTANLVAAATARGARRMMAVVGAGVLQADEHHLRNEMPGYPPFLVEITKEHTAVWHALRASTLDWILACAPDIADGPASGKCAVAANVLPDGTRRVTTGDIAAFLVREAEAPRFSRTRVGLNTPI